MILPATTLILTLSATISSVSGAAVPSVQTRIPLVRRQTWGFLLPSGEASIPVLQTTLNNVVEKYVAAASTIKHNLEWNDETAAVTAPALPLVRREERSIYKRQSVSLLDISNESLWAGYVTIGGQSILVDFDTGSNDLWVSGPGTSQHTYAPSSTAKVMNSSTTAFAIHYGDGSGVSGPIYNDTVSIGGYSASAQVFSPVAAENGQDTRVSGILGLGLRYLSYLATPNLVATLYNQKVIAANTFSFKLATSGSELYIGGSNPNLYSGAFTTAPVVTQLTAKGTQYYTYWQLNGTAASNSSSVGYTGGFIIDTGTTLIVAPVASAAAFYAGVPTARLSSVTGYYEYNCSIPINLSFSFGASATRFAVPPAYVNIGASTTPGYCYSALTGKDTGHASWIVGDPFLRSVYSTYNAGPPTAVGYATVGFATLK